AADLLETVGVPRDRRRRLARRRHRLALDVHQRGDDVELRLALGVELLPARGGLRALLPLCLQANGVHAIFFAGLAPGAVAAFFSVSYLRSRGAMSEVSTGS